jgi:hypothetical protein
MGSLKYMPEANVVRVGFDRLPKAECSDRRVVVGRTTRKLKIESGLMICRWKKNKKLYVFGKSPYLILPQHEDFQ